MLEEEGDELDLSEFFGVGWGEEVAVVDVFAPCVFLLLVAGVGEDGRTVIDAYDEIEIEMMLR